MEHNEQVPERGREQLGLGLESLFRTLKLLFIGLRFFIFGAMIFMVFSGVFVVRNYEKAMQFRFGSLIENQGTDGVLSSGRIYWGYPYPIDEVIKIPALQTITVNIKNFLVYEDRIKVSDLSTAARNNVILVPGKDGYLLTGDANIIHVSGTMTYTITDPKKFYLRYYKPIKKLTDSTEQKKDPSTVESTIENLLSEAIIMEASQTKIDDLRVSRANNRASLNSVIEQRMNNLIEDMQLGITIKNVNLNEFKPPTATIAAFDKINQAAQEKDTLKQKALTKAQQIRSNAQNAAKRIISDAKSYQYRVEKSIIAQRDYFNAIYAKCKDNTTNNPSIIISTLHIAKIQEALAKIKTKYYIHNNKTGKQEIRILIGEQPKKIEAIPVATAPKAGN